MPHGKWLLVALSLAVFALCLAVACGGGSKGGGTATPGGGTATPGAGTATPGGSPTASAITNELQALGTEWEKIAAKVSYDATTSSGSSSDKTSITLYWRPPDWRMEISSSTQGSAILIVAGGAIYECSTESGLSQCVSYDTSQVDVSAPLGLFDPDAAAANLAGYDVDRSERAIGGEAAACFSLTTTTGTSTSKSEWCFASDGILLQYSDTSDDPTGANVTMEATSVNRNVTDADFDFEPPYPVTPYVPPVLATPSPSSQAPASPTPPQALASPTPVP
jgi:outer membrane lipoprotein-sorting protein